ncbi:hypothetical protein GCM10011515_10230 [Tsuneonella deserti]|uniref:SPOR domain-containing protein n=1 Tax=Tsuneonella deserti TaxID=2035528 RepID=A0ABQ1S475_9SPHN|nr:hypothetical protein GCM10011515_10230 [Tsuneonella deserti]
MPADAASRLLIFGLATTLAGCGAGGDRSGVLPVPVAAAAVNGPAADYPIVLGEPFSIDGVNYTPADTLNYDAVGYAGVEDGNGVTAAHRTLPLPSYVEVTSLDTGKTILVRIERRGPMTGGNLLALSPAAASQLGISGTAPVRVRRVNPSEAERAELRAGRDAPARLETPKSLVEVLRRKLPAVGATSLRDNGPATGRSGVAPAAGITVEADSFEVSPVPAVAATGVAHMSDSAPAQASKAEPFAKGGFVVQVGAFANRANAERAAKAIDGFVSPSGKLFRVRTGPFAKRAQADATLAKVRSAGYRDARVYTAD